jgi:Domain of unknown function (DUF4279)
MWETSEVKVSLTIHGRDLDPDWVGQLLGADPDRKHRRGERGLHPYPMPTKGMWSISTEGLLDPSVSVDVHIRSLLYRVAPDETIWAQLSDAFHCRIFVGWFLEKPNEMVELDPDLLGEIARRRLRLDFDVYGADTRDATGQDIDEGSSQQDC